MVIKLSLQINDSGLVPKLTNFSASGYRNLWGQKLTFLTLSVRLETDIILSIRWWSKAYSFCYWVLGYWYNIVIQLTQRIQLILAELYVIY